MAKKSGSKRKRDKKGHFTSATRKAARRANPRKTKKRSAKKRSGTVRIKRALGRKRSSGKFTRRGKHKVRSYRRKVKGRSTKKLVRAHLSYENPVKKRRRPRRATEASMAQANPRRRTTRRRASKARRHHHAVMENPRPKKRRSPKRRRSARRSTTAVVPAVVRRRSSRKGGRRTTQPGKIVVQIAGLGGSRRKPAKRRRSSAKRKSRKGKGHRKGYTRKSHQLTMGSAAEAGFFENPLGGNFLENPLSGGEIALAAFTGTIGYALTDMLDRYLAIQQYATTANGVTIQPSAAPRTVPGITRILAQAAAAAVPLAAAHFVNEPMGKAALQGAGLGALFHLGGQLVNHYVMTWIGQQFTSVAPLYQMETQADAAAAGYNGTTAAGTTAYTGTLSGPPSAPRGLAAPKALVRPQPSIPFHDPGPRAAGVAGAPKGVGSQPAGTVGDIINCQGRDDNSGSGMMPPGGGVGSGNGCGPGPCEPTDCGSRDSSAAAASSALNGVPAGFIGLGSSYEMFADE